MLVLNLPFKALMFLTLIRSSLFFFFNDTATTEIYTLSLHDALPIFLAGLLQPIQQAEQPEPGLAGQPSFVPPLVEQDRKSTRLNSSHLVISYAVFCLKKKKKKRNEKMNKKKKKKKE